MHNGGNLCIVPNQNLFGADVEKLLTGYNDYTKHKQSVSITVNYNYDYDKTEVGYVSLVNPEDVEFAEGTFQKHGLLVNFEMGKYHKRNTEICISNIPRFINSDRYLKWFVNRICGPNEIDVNNVHFKRRKARKLSNQNSFFGPNFTAKFVMSFDSLRLLNRTMDHREKIKDLKMRAENVEDLPFKLSEHLLDAGERQIVAKFDEENCMLGQQLGHLCLSNKDDPHFMRFTATRALPAIISPKFQRMLPLPRSIRNVCQIGVENFDEKLKKKMEEYFHLNGRDRNIDRSTARIVDDYVDDSDDGFTGIEGWPPSIVDHCVELLSRVFNPKIIDVNDENRFIFFGIGESYIKSFIKYKAVIVDFDRYRSKIFVYGDAANDFIEWVDEFALARATILFEAEVPLRNAHCQPMFMKMLDNTVIEQLGNYLNSDIQISSKSILFRGSCASYETLKRMLSTMENKIISSLCMKSLKYSSCPVCLCSIDDNFYSMENCAHKYCYDCICDMVKSMIDMTRFDIKCCFEQCQESISPVDLKRLILGDENRVKMLDAEKLQLLNARVIEYIVTQPGSALKFCTTVDCIGTLKISQDSFPVNCEKCGRKYCPQCLEEPHPHVESCQEYARTKIDADHSLKLFIASTGNQNYRKCPTPKCCAIIEKKEGCDHIECPFCRCHFCWKCSFRSEKVNELYTHMTDTHGGSGGEWPINMELLGGADLDEALEDGFQQMLLEQHQHHV